MLAPDLDDITITTLRSLIASGTPERKQLKFKRQLDPSNKDHKSKLLANTTSFANTIGGDLLIGVPDPDEVDDDADEELW